MIMELTEVRIKHLREEYVQGFIAFCGIEAVKFGLGTLEARVNIRAEHRQQDGFIHAGLAATLADHTAGYAAYTMIPEDHRILTIEFKMNFLRPAYSDALVCRARVIKPGRRVLVCESEVFDQRPQGEVLAAKTLTTMASTPQSDLQKDRSKNSNITSRPAPES